MILLVVFCGLMLAIAIALCARTAANLKLAKARVHTLEKRLSDTEARHCASDRRAKSLEDEIATRDERSNALQKELETRLWITIDKMPQLVWSTDGQWSHTSFNRRWSEVTGQASEGGPDDGWLAHVHPEDRERVGRLWDHALSTGEDFEIESRLRCRTGEFRWFLGRATALRDNHGTVIHWYGTFTDIHAQKMHIETLALAEQESRARLEKTAHTEEGLQRALRMRDEFLATLSHELRTPMNVIQSWIHLMRIGRVKADEIPKVLDTLQRNCQAQIQLINDLLDVSRIINGKFKLETSELNMGRTVHEGIEALRFAADQKGVTIATDIPPTLPPVTGDHDRILQVIWNLMSNAVKFTPAGGWIGVHVYPLGDELIIDIRDTGIGIEAPFLPLVFNRFSQEDASMTRKVGGLGLGLALVRHITELHGGTVSVMSAGKDKGTTFSIRFPTGVHVEEQGGVPSRSGSPADGPGRAAGDAGPDLSGKEILIVDDAADALDVMQFALSKTGAHVTLAGSAREAMARLRERPFDLLISDIGMPGEDGYDLIQQVRSQSGCQSRELPAIALTAYAQQDERQRALSSGFQIHVAKPVAPKELVTLVRSVLRGPRPTLH